MTSLSLVNMGKAFQEILEEFEDFIRVLFVKFKNTFIGSFGFIVKSEVPVEQVREKVVQSSVHLTLEVHQTRVVEWNSNVACVGGSGILSHWTKAKLKSCRLRESGVDKYWSFCVSSRILHLDEESENEK